MQNSGHWTDEALTERIIQCIIKVHRTLGPGFLESIYQTALVIELESAGLHVEREREILIYYEGHLVGKHRLDLVVENSIILELKTVEDLCRAHYAQVRSYLKATSFRLGLLVNFSTEKADFRRVTLN